MNYLVFQSVLDINHQVISHSLLVLVIPHIEQQDAAFWHHLLCHIKLNEALAGEHVFVLGIFECFHARLIINGMQFTFLGHKLSTTKHLSITKREYMHAT